MCSVRSEPDALGAEVAGELRVVGVVGVGTPRRCVRTSSAHSRMVSKIAGERRAARAPRHPAPRQPVATVDGDHVALVDARRPCRLTTDLLLLRRRSSRASAPHTQGAPMPRAMTAAWLVLPPWRREDALGGDHAGQVVGVGLPAHEDAVAPRLGSGHGVGRAEKTTSPTAAPGEAFRPMAEQVVGGRSCRTAGAAAGRAARRVDAHAAASSLVMRPSRLHARWRSCSAAAAVRLPTRVWSIQSLPCSMVNSMSHMSR